jgi:hypothetical protein
MADALVENAVADVFWLDPARIRFKISPCADLSGRVGGDWDLDRRFPLGDAVKHRAIVQRYREGRRWPETDLFREAYAPRLAAGQSIRGVGTMGELVAQYEDRVDAMFASLAREGFRADRGPLPRLFVGRDGDIFIGNQGNHRLAMAQLLELKSIAGRITCRHSLNR